MSALARGDEPAALRAYARMMLGAAPTSARLCEAFEGALTENARQRQRA